MSEIEKANYRKDQCMVCKDRPPTTEVRWANGKARSWFCDLCFMEWAMEHNDDIHSITSLKDGKASTRYKRVTTSPRSKEKKKVNKSTLLSINGYKVLLSDLAQAWLIQKEKFTDAPWSNPESNLSIKQFARVCLIDLNEPGKEPTKGNYKLPIRSTPGGPINRNALRAAAAALAGARGGLSAPEDEKRKAAKTVVGLMRQAGIEAGDSILRIAGIEKSIPVEKNWEFEVVEKQEEKQIAYGLILRPDKADSQGDIYTAEEVEKAAHRYMAKAAGRADWQHQVDLPRDQAVMVESFIAPVDFDWNGFRVLKGDWMGGMWIPDKDKWQAVKAGQIQAFSIKGQGRRIPIEEQK